MAIVRFEPYGVEVDVPEGTTLMAAADQAATRVVDEFFVGECCEGRLECGNCCLQIVKGMENLSPASQAEQDLLKVVGKGENWRASCAAKVQGPVIVRVLAY